jgi:hypothetical protein
MFNYKNEVKDIAFVHTQKEPIPEWNAIYVTHSCHET